MPIFFYQIRPLSAAIILLFFFETVSLIGLFIARRFVLPHFRYSEGVNDAVSGTVQAIGVFYGVTVGLIAVGVWNTASNASDLVSREATAIGSLYRDVSGYPAPVRDELRGKLREYTVFVIEKSWPAQKIGKGQTLDAGTKIMDDFQYRLYAFQPANASQTALHSETLTAYNKLIDLRRLRIDAVDNGLSSVMWGVIWFGAAISIGVAYLFKIEDGKMHAVLIGLMAGFLSLV
ncbi:MAG TPA: hypothetical protein VKD91_19195, partial [Pyrinomonadaceae bacterium]|nr:hypothetical protein [Pyrinomonadaceae bacterium]